MTVVWCLSWRRPARQRWARLGIAGAVAVLASFIGAQMPPLAPGEALPLCSSAFDCHPASSLFWSGISDYGIAWFVLLVLTTSTIDLLRIIFRPKGCCRGQSTDHTGNR